MTQATLSGAVGVLRSSPMIFALCLMVISYGVGHRLFEFAWKGQLRMQYPSALAYQVIHPCLPAPAGKANDSLIRILLSSISSIHLPSSLAYPGVSCHRCKRGHAEHVCATLVTLLCQSQESYGFGSRA